MKKFNRYPFSGTVLFKAENNHLLLIFSYLILSIIIFIGSYFLGFVAILFTAFFPISLIFVSLLVQTFDSFDSLSGKIIALILYVIAICVCLISFIKYFSLGDSNSVIYYAFLLGISYNFRRIVFLFLKHDVKNSDKFIKYAILNKNDEFSNHSRTNEFFKNKYGNLEDLKSIFPIKTYIEALFLIFQLSCFLWIYFQFDNNFKGLYLIFVCILFEILNLTSIEVGSYFPYFFCRSLIIVIAFFYHLNWLNELFIGISWFIFGISIVLMRKKHSSGIKGDHNKSDKVFNVQVDAINVSFSSKNTIYDPDAWFLKE
eukprot:TRINITY_DN1240_c0_g1_i1.p1 TRINITY_DN1240_c0_g1~~TRINITY_DN1240_c0_g1_i1.p1  ORF type:complete len:315 (+),score=49.19 TRINITY_DN1240_c0_g1_i1:56-1000(+)